MGLLYVRCSVGIYCKGAPVAFMPRLYEERGLRDVLGRSCHASLSMCAEARKLDGCHHDAGEDEAAPKKAMALRTSPTRKNEKTAEQTGSSEKAKPVVSAGTWGCTSVWVIKP